MNPIRQAPIFAEMLKPDTVRAAWKGVARNKGGPGDDGVTIQSFAHNLDLNLDRLCRRISDGSYLPGPVRRVRIAKPSGGHRMLSIPCVVDRVAQKALALAAQPVFEAAFEDSSFAYRPGRSVNMAARAVTAHWRDGFSYVVDADIKAYFDNVPHDRLLHRFNALIPEPPVVRLVKTWLDASGQGIGLPQGGPISPYLANLYLDDLDEVLADEGFRLVRYADDFVLLARTRQRAEEAHTLAASVLADLGLSFHPDKTTIISFDEGFDFVGRWFSAEHLVDDPDGLDMEERAAVNRMAAAPPSANARPVRELSGVFFQEPEDADRTDAHDTLFRFEHDPESPDSDPTMPILFVTTPGARLEARNEALAVRLDGTEAWARAPENISRIDIFPDVEVSAAALRLAASRDVPLHWVSASGIEVARIEPRIADRGRLHLAQARLTLDPERALEFSRTIAAARILNARNVAMGWRTDLMRRLRTAPDSDLAPAMRETVATVEDVAKRMQVLAAECGRLEDAAMLRSREGRGTEQFLQVLRTSLTDWNMGPRTRRPARDPVNAVLNYLSALLERDISTILRSAGLHPGLGVYHATADNAEALTYDLMEEFRAPVVEALAKQLFNRRELKATDFAVDAEGATRIHITARRRLLTAYQSHVCRRNKRGENQREKMSFRLIFRKQIAQFRQCVLDNQSYVAYSVDY